MLDLGRCPPHRGHVGGTDGALQLDLHRRPGWFFEDLNQIDCVRQVLDRLGHGSATERSDAGVSQQRNGRLFASRVLGVIGRHLRAGRHHFGKPFAQRGVDAIVDARPFALQQRRVEGVLNERMLEDVNRVRADPRGRRPARFGSGGRAFGGDRRR